MGNEIVLCGKFTAEANTFYIDSVSTHIREVCRVGTVVFNEFVSDLGVCFFIFTIALNFEHCFTSD